MIINVLMFVQNEKMIFMLFMMNKIELNSPYQNNVKSRKHN